MLNRYYVFILLLQLVHTGLLGQNPGWLAPNPTAFSHNASIIAAVQLNDIRSDDMQDRVAYFSGNTLVGLSTPVQTGSGVVHFITVFANSASATLTAKLYHASTNTVYDVQDPYNFIAQQISGSFEQPYPVLAYTDSDAPISLEPIPNQFTLENRPFQTIFLRPYLQQSDHDPIAWTYQPNIHLNVAVIQDTLFITPKIGFIGTTSLLIRATEQTTQQYFAEATIHLQVSEKYPGPDWVPVPGEGILPGGNFETLILPNYEQQYGGPCLQFDYAPVISPSDHPVAKPTWELSEIFQNSMTITAEVMFTPRYHFAHPDDVLAAFAGSQLRGVAIPQTINGRTLYFLHIGSNTATTELRLLFYSGYEQKIHEIPMPVPYLNGAVLGSPDEPYPIDLSPLLPVIDHDGNLNVQIQHAEWTGRLPFSLIASDCTYPLEYSDTTGVVFCVIGQAFSAGSIASAGETICYAGTPSEIGSTLHAEANCYLWRSSADSFSVPISGADGPVYTPTAGLTTTTSYRRYAYFDECMDCPVLSSGTWTVTVLPAPDIVCPDNQLIVTSADGEGDCQGTTSWTHPVELAGACTPHHLIMRLNQLPDEQVIPGDQMHRTLPGGVNILHYTLTDGGGNQAYCSFSITVVDDEQPILTCVSDTTLEFNGEFTRTLTIDHIGSVSDNCALQSVVFNPAQLSVQQLGQVIPVFVVAQDTTGNVSTCSSNVEVIGLPEGWSHHEGSVGNCSSSMDYDPHTGIWTARSSNCVTTSPFMQDVQHFAQRSLCGNGSITARVVGISGGSAWAGVIMRESIVQGAKKVQLMVNGVSNTGIREWRTATGGQAYPAPFSNIFIRNWVRIERQGDVFKGYTSADGATWWQVMQIYIPMNSCIEIGLVVNNVQANALSTVHFTNVQTTGNRTPQVQVPDRETLATDMPTLDIYPNPGHGDFAVLYSGDMSAIRDVRVFNAYGQCVYAANIFSGVINLNSKRPGIYRLRMTLNDGLQLHRSIVLLE